MLLEKFKQGKEINLVKAIQKYIANHYEDVKYSKIEGFINSITSSRSVAISLNSFEKSAESLKSYKEQLVTYLCMLNLLKSKFNFGNDNFSIKLELGWKDILNNDFYYSYNINHEFYSVLFNLAIAYYSIGRCDHGGDETKMKDAIKYFQYSAFIFDKIKQEIPGVVPAKEIQPDLSTNYLTYASYLCLANAQTLVYEVAVKKGLALELQAQLARGVFDIYTLAYNLSKESLKKQISEECRIFLNNRRYYYFAFSLLKMKDATEEIFKAKAEGYGKMIAYMKLCIDALKEGEKDIMNAKNLINIKDYTDFKAQVEAKYNEMNEKNTRIYYDSVPESKNLPKIEKLIKANPLQNPDEYNKNIEGQNCLDDMVPKEVRGMVEKYKKSILDFITSCLDKYENEVTIQQFLNGLGLPTSLETIMTMNDIPDNLWKRILETQKKGGAMYITNTLQLLEKKSEEIGKKIVEIETMLYNESEDDAKYRNMYLNRWTRKSSQSLNVQFFQILFDYKQKLTQAKSCDSLVKEGIINNMKYYELINLTRDQLKNKIPVKTDTNTISNSEEVKTLSSELEVLEGLKVKFIENVNKIFQTLNEDNIITQMIKVLQKKTTEQAIIDENKSKYETLLKTVEELNTLIIESKNRISEKNEKFLKLKMESMKTSHENEKFCADLESYVQLYNQKSSGLSQGLSFYSDFAYRVNIEFQKATDFVLARDTEKNEIIKNLNNGTQVNNNNKDPFSGINLLNPSTNVITNMDYKYHYNPGTQYSYYNTNNQNKTNLNNSSYNIPNNQQNQNFQNSNSSVFNHPAYNPNYNYGPNYNQKK